VELVQLGIPLSTKHGFSELRRLANSYDELLIHRNKLEQNLREMGLTDALTGLPNRLAYQEYLKGLEERPEDSAVTVYSMDVNGLKGTNDSRGHLCGDILLRDSAACILKIFGDKTGKNVFRIGGDEFAAICLGQSEADIARMLESFREEQAHYSISISVGYAYAKSLKDEKLQKLFNQADQDMYSNKIASKKNRV
jgi:diguanylate cyclase (GGDEF)-like protein